MEKAMLRVTALAALALMAACAQRPAPESAEPAPAPAPVAPTYDAQTLADLLVAEVAAQRNALSVTMGYYDREARDTADPEVARQAARLAAYLDDPVAAVELGQLWLQRDPGNREAHEILALSYIKLGDRQQAANHIDVLLQDSPQASLTELVSHARGLGPQGNQQLLDVLGSLTDRYPDQAPLWYARALSLQMDGDLEGALAACERTLKLNKLHEDALLLKARLMFELGDHDGALRHLARLQKKYPHARRVRVLQARLLMEADRREEAAEALRELSERYPEDRDLRFSLALYGLERGNTEPARAALSDLLAEGYRPNDVNLFLARAAEDAGDPHAAIDHYLAINGGDKVLQAQVQAGRLMFDVDQSDRAARHMERLRAEHPDKMPSLYAAEAEMLSSHGRAPEALDLLNQALVRLPDQADLLYARAMVAEKLDNLAQLEADLRRMLELKPGDATALNALGYTLADRGLRLEEARQMIQAAYDQRPDDPAIIDSMGWVHYRLGQLDIALDYLRQAWEAFPDHEVAAHYGEVLWQLGQRDEARRIWRDALVEHPGSDKIRETVERLTGDPQP